jgi:biopolymer transport protein ExbB
MKKILSIFMVAVMFIFSTSNLSAQDEMVEDVNQEVVEESMMSSEPVVEEEPAPRGFTQELKNRFIEGGPGFMGIVLACLIFGLAIAIERIIGFYI